ncbi:amidohydrolase family protein [Nocardioides sp. Kera G14]|uniref:amidohydrolase family protein n=1 Tax=Nocardioides sp. Kera G14 TaxID=2884264 RepID=UPI001D124160|nr:amidohydrolase family protein [Nocardioides sp. Kera G14]UDY23930.1 amidohydrolase [Nocardioides sp. Kera G14]
MYIDCHTHFTTVPDALKEWRDRQIAEYEEHGGHLSPDGIEISDDELVQALTSGQLALQAEHGIDLSLLSPIAGKMAHHYGDQETSTTWSRLANDTVYRAVQLFPQSFVGVAQLPQSPGSPIDACVEELHRCVEDLGFVGCNLNPDPSDGSWAAPPITDRSYYPLYEAMVELGVPAMVHASMSANPAVHGTCAHYLNGDTTAFMQLCLSDLFRDFPDLKLIIPHGGGAVPYHWGRYQGVMLDQGRGDLIELIGRNVFFDTCVYWQRGMQLLVDTVPSSNILFASEMIGAVRGIDPSRGRRYDDTRSLLESLDGVSQDDLSAISSGNALRVFPRLAAALDERGITLPETALSIPVAVS